MPSQFGLTVNLLGGCKNQSLYGTTHLLANIHVKIGLVVQGGSGQPPHTHFHQLLEFAAFTLLTK